MTDSDEALRARILDAAADLFAQYGFSGTKVGMVAKAAGVSNQKVRRLTGGRAELFEEVITARARSSAADRLREAVEDPTAAPPLAVMLAVAQDVYTNPEASWDILELEALTRAHLDEQVREIESERMEVRRRNSLGLLAQIRSGGGLDDDISDAVIAHLSMALSVGVAMLDPVIEKPSRSQWNALIARIGAAMVPQDLDLSPEFAAGDHWRVRVDIPDRPGSLARLVRAMGSLHTYSLGVWVIGRRDEFRTIDMALIAPTSVNQDVLRAAAQSVGKHVYIGHGSADDDIDLPTRVLNGAIEMVARPDWAPLAAAKLVEADEVEVTDATEGEDDSPDVMRLQWTPEQHVVLQRSWAPFAAAERGRASAFLRLSGAIAMALGNEEASGWVEDVKGGSVWIRMARPEDAEAVAAMHERSSERSRYQRYFSLSDWRGVRLHRLSGGHRGATLVVMSESGQIVGFGNVFPDPTEGSGAAEIAMIIEDDFQGRGIGKKLVQSLISFAMRLGFTEVVASVLADNKGMLRLLEWTGLNWTTQVEDSVAEMRAPLPIKADVTLA